MIAIIDYGVGNLFSLKSSLAMIGAQTVVTGDAQEIRSRMSLYLERLRRSEKIPGCARIYTAGEKAFETMKARLVSGIPVEEKTLGEVRRIAQELGVEGV